MVGHLMWWVPDWLTLAVASVLLAVPCSTWSEEVADHAPLECFDEVVDAPLIIFISIDTLRADYLGCHGNSWIATPNIDALASESIQLTDFMTVVPTTAASHTSMFTGKYPHTHGVPRNAFTIPDANIMLPEVLQANGYETVAIIAASPLMKTFNFDQGFDVFDDADLPKAAELVTQRAIDALDGLSEGDKTFLFVHYWDAHHPREAREPFFSEYSALTAEDIDDGPRVSDRNFLYEGCDEEQRLEMLRYASEISYMDQQIGMLLSELKQRGLYDQALILLTSDHGEGFLDHPPHTLHGDHVYQEQISVPCILRFPEGSAAPAILDRPTASIDLMPTLLHAIGIQSPDGVEGNVVLGFRGSGEGAVGEPDLYCEATTPHSGQTVHPNEVGTRWLNERKRRCIRSGKYKYIIYPFNPKESPQLFDLSVDWAERANLLQTSPGEYEAMAAELHSKLAAWGQGSEGIDSKLSEEMSEAEIDALKALGYL